MNPKSWIEMNESEREALRELAGMLESAKNYVYVQDKKDRDSKTLTKDELVIKMIKGIELGFSPMQALDSLYNERGKLTLHAEAMLALAWSSGEMTHFEIVKNDKTGCWLKIGRNGMEPVPVEFTEADAKAAGLLGKAGNWTTRTVLMYRHRAVSKAVRMMFADRTQGLYMTGELSEGDFYEEDGEADRIYGKEIRELEEQDSPKEETKVISLPKSERIPPKLDKQTIEEAQKPTPEMSDDEIDAALNKNSELYPGKTDEGLKEEIKTLIKGASNLITAAAFGDELNKAGLSLKEWTRDKHGAIMDKVVEMITQEKLKVAAMERPSAGINGNGHKKEKAPVLDEDFELKLYDDDEEEAGFSTRKAVR